MHSFKIQDRLIGEGQPCYIIAEISCNHEGNFNEAKRIIEAAAAAGADAVKLQSYTPDTMTGDFKNNAKGTMWENIDLYKLYQKAYTPWEWYKDLKRVADDNNVHIFSSPFDETAVDFLLEQDVPALKIASFEIVDTKLVEKIAKSGKPVIVSNGMTDFLELKEAIDILRQHGVKDLAILHCNSGYPASFDEVNLKTIPVIEDLFGCVSGLSDHTIFADDKNYELPMAHVTPLEGVKHGAKIIELHLMMDRDKARELNDKEEGGFDWPFSREPHELKKMIDMIRAYERGEDVQYDTLEQEKHALRTHGYVCFEPTLKEIASRAARPCLWVTQDIKKGETFSFAAEKDGNFNSLRPGGGLHIRFSDYIEGARAAHDIKAGTPMAWDMVDGK